MKLFFRRNKTPPARLSAHYLAAPFSSAELDLGYEAALPYLNPLSAEAAQTASVATSGAAPEASLALRPQASAG